MCGIVGIIAKAKIGLYSNHANAFREMLFADEVRGSHGTGMFYNSSKKVYTLKAPIPASEFLSDPKVDKAITGLPQEALFAVGHNRAATKGALTHENTHPHRDGHIILIHNGTLRAHKELADVESDSLAICKSIAKRGAAETIKMINGAYALVWYNTQEKTLNITRNTERPLWMIETNNAWIICSEPKMGEWICERNKMHISESKPFLPGNLYSYSIKSFDFTITPTEMYESPYKYVRPTPVLPWAGGNQSWQNAINGYDYYDETRLPSSRDALIPPIKEPNSIPPVEKNGSVISFSPFQIVEVPGKLGEFYLEGESDTGVDTRLYHSHRPTLQHFLDQDELLGEIKAIAFMRGKRLFYMKNVKLQKPLSPPPALLQKAH